MRTSRCETAAVVTLRAWASLALARARGCGPVQPARVGARRPERRQRRRAVAVAVAVVFALPGHARAAQMLDSLLLLMSAARRERVLNRRREALEVKRLRELSACGGNVAPSGRGVEAARRPQPGKGAGAARSQ
jgi:hypothetical protein